MRSSRVAAAVTLSAYLVGLGGISPAEAAAAASQGAQTTMGGATNATPARSTMDIEHAAVTCVLTDKFPRVDACFTGAPLAQAQVRFRGTSDDPWYFVSMEPFILPGHAAGTCYTAYLPKPTGNEIPQFYYYVNAVDSSTAVAARPDKAPEDNFRAKVVKKESHCVGTAMKIAAWTKAIGKPIVVQLARDMLPQMTDAAFAALARRLVPTGFSAEGVTNGQSSSSEQETEQQKPAGGGGGGAMLGVLAGGLAAAASVYAAKNAADTVEAQRCYSIQELISQAASGVTLVNSNTGCQVPTACPSRGGNIRSCITVSGCTGTAYYLHSSGQRFECGSASLDKSQPAALSLDQGSCRTVATNFCR